MRKIASEHNSGTKGKQRTNKRVEGDTEEVSIKQGNYIVGAELRAISLLKSASNHSVNRGVCFIYLHSRRNHSIMFL